MLLGEGVVTCHIHSILSLSLHRASPKKKLNKWEVGSSPLDRIVWECMEKVRETDSI